MTNNNTRMWALFLGQACEENLPGWNSISTGKGRQSRALHTRWLRRYITQCNSARVSLTAISYRHARSSCLLLIGLDKHEQRSRQNVDFWTLKLQRKFHHWPYDARSIHDGFHGPRLPGGLEREALFFTSCALGFLHEELGHFEHTAHQGFAPQFKQRKLFKTSQSERG